MSQESINQANDDIAKTGLDSMAIARAVDGGAGFESATEDDAPEAININLKTRSEVENEFKEELGFDPSDIDQMSEHLDGDSGSDFKIKDSITNLLELQQSMSEMLIDRFQHNMEAFKKYIPDIYEQFKDYRPNESIEFICTSNGIPNLFFPERNEFFYKTYDPVNLCNKQVDMVLERCPFRQLKYSVDQERLGQIHHRYLNEIINFQKDRVPNNANPLLSNSCPICIIVGCGLGYHIGHLYERIEIGNMVLIEPNADLFFASLHAFDWANLLEFIHENNRGVYLMIGQDKDQVFEDLNLFYKRHGRMLACFMWSMVHYRSKVINEIADRIIEDFERSYATLGFYDDHVFAISQGIHHVMSGAHFMRRNPPLKDEYRNIPVCVVANGPSLSKDLPFLRKVQDKVFIMACGTAIETLYNAGIKPTFYACTERLRVVSEHLSLIPDSQFIRDCILIAGDVVHPEVVKFFDHTAIMGKADETFYWLAAAKIYDQMRKVCPVSLMNPLVANMGVASTSQMQFENIYFFGCDNGTKKEDYNTHPEENIFYNKISKNAGKHSRANLPYTLEGNFGGEVAASYLYKLSARYMEVIIRSGRKAGINYFNCSDGAALKGADPIHTSELEEWLDLPDIDFKKFVDYMDNEKTMQISFTDEEYKSMIDTTTFEYVVDIVKKCLNREKRPESRLEYVFLLQGVSEILNRVTETRDYYAADLIDGSLYSMFAMLLRSLYLIEDEKEAIEVTEEQIKFINYFLEDAVKIYHFIPDYCAEDHQKHLNGKIGYDHEFSKAPDLVKREPLVTDEDRANYPTRKFVKRYE